MRCLLVIGLVMLVGFICFAEPGYAQTASSLYAGTGQSTSSLANPNVSEMAHQAATEAKQNYDNSSGQNSAPEVILVMQTIESNAAIQSAIDEVFGGVPIFGHIEAWVDYTPYTIESMPGSSTERSIAMVALGGDAIDVAWVTGTGMFSQDSNTEAFLAGQDLATKLIPKLNATKKNLLLIFGPLHGSLSDYLIRGMKDVMGDPLPDYLRIIGWSGSYWGNQIYENGIVKNDTALGVLLSGDFSWVFSGVDHGELGWDGAGTSSGDPIVEIPKHYDKVIAELGQIPSVSFMVLGHPPRSSFPAIRDGIATRIGAAAMFGTHGGSEVGHDETNGQVIVDGNHFFLAGVAPAVPSPFAKGDINQDGAVNGADVTLLLTGWMFSAPCGVFACDLNLDNIINSLDFAKVAQGWSN